MMVPLAMNVGQRAGPGGLSSPEPQASRMNGSLRARNQDKAPGPGFGRAMVATRAAKGAPAAGQVTSWWRSSPCSAPASWSSCRSSARCCPCPWFHSFESRSCDWLPASRTITIIGTICPKVELDAESLPAGRVGLDVHAGCSLPGIRQSPAGRRFIGKNGSM